MATSIQSVSVAQDVAAAWGINVYEYKMNGGAQLDFQDLMVAVAERRAVSVEGEVSPMAVRIRTRNKFLDDLGAALAELTQAQATLDGDADGDDRCDYTFSQSVRDTCYRAYGKRPSNNDTKMWLEYHIQMVKSKIDGLNNQAQTDMSRLQSLVDRRDESYSTATNLMTNVSDTRSNLIRNL